MTRFRSCGMALLALCTAGIGSPSFAQQPIVIKFSHVVAPNTPKGRGAEFFKKKAEELTKGRVRVEVYPNSTLYKDQEELEALQLGAVQMLAPSLAKFGPLAVKEFEVFDIPYIFPTREVLQRVEEGPIGQQLLKLLEPRGIVGMAFWDNGFKIMSSNKPIAVPSDLKGQKFRIQSSKVLDAQMRQLGVLPQVMALSEVYQALQTGVVDGTENPPSNLYTQKMYEFQKYAVDTNHGYLGYAVIVNKRFWEGLPTDVRGELTAAMKEATRYANTISQQENDEALAAIEKSGKTKVVRLTDAERKVWRDALLPVQKEVAGRVGVDLVNAINKEAGVVASK